MSGRDVLPVITSSSKNSIWRGVGRPEFHGAVAELQSVTHVPADKVEHTRQNFEGELDREYALSFKAERFLADGFALLSSLEPDALSVTAVTLEEDRENQCITLRLAANGPIAQTIKNMLTAVMRTLQDCAARKISRDVCQAMVYCQVVDTLRQRIHGRLHSARWQTPRYLLAKPRFRIEPLSDVLQSLSCSPRFGFPLSLRSDMRSLCETIKLADTCEVGTDSEIEILQRIITACYQFCKESTHQMYMNLAMTSKRHVQVKKLARYFYTCQYMAQASRHHRSLFQQMKLEVLPRFEAESVTTSPILRTFECFVHAEIQHIAFYARNAAATKRTPRVIGVSRSACYLCSLFIRYYSQYFVSRTHGKLYHMWTVPDVFQYSSLETQRETIRRVLQGMIGEIRRVLLIERQRVRAGLRERLFPIESNPSLPQTNSWPDLLSNAGTIVSASSSATATTTVTPRASQLTIKGSLAVPDHPLALQNRSSESTNEENEPLARVMRERLSFRPTSPQTRLQSSQHYGTSPRAPSPPEPLSPASRPEEQPGQTTLTAPIFPSHSSSPPTAPKLSSTSTVDSWEYPLTRTLIPSHSLRTCSQNMRMTFEMEAGAAANGKIEVSNAPRIDRNAIKHTIDVSQIAPGDRRVVKKNESEEDLVVNLQNGEKSGMTQVTFKWD